MLKFDGEDSSAIFSFILILKWNGFFPQERNATIIPQQNQTRLVAIERRTLLQGQQAEYYENAKKQGQVGQ